MTGLNPATSRLCCVNHHSRDATHIYGPAVPPVTVLPDGTRYVHPKDAAKAAESWLPLCDECSTGTDPEIRQYPAATPEEAVPDWANHGWRCIGVTGGQIVMLHPNGQTRIHPARATPPPRDVLELARVAR